MVLIDMEMPKCCGKCPCFYAEHPMRCQADCEKPKRACAAPYAYRPVWCPLKEFTQSKPKVTVNLYDQEEIHRGCTVQILRNSVTGDVSVGWWKEEG